MYVQNERGYWKRLLRISFVALFSLNSNLNVSLHHLCFLNRLNTTVPSPLAPHPNHSTSFSTPAPATSGSLPLYVPDRRGARELMDGHISVTTLWFACTSSSSHFSRFSSESPRLLDCPPLVAHVSVLNSCAPLQTLPAKSTTSTTTPSHPPMLPTAPHSASSMAPAA